MCCEDMQHIYRRTPMPKCDFNRFALQLYWNHTSAWVSSYNLLHIFRTSFPKITFGGLILILAPADLERLMINITEKFLDALFPLSAVSIVKIIDVNYWERCQLLKEYWERCKLFQNQCPRQWPSVAKLFSSHLRPRGTRA